MRAALHLAAALIALFALVGAARASDDSELKSGVFSPPRQAPDFTLKGTDGSDLKLSRYRGRIVALGFGYTMCPDICPTQLAQLAEVHRKLGAAGKDFQVVYVTVDPERDSAERLRQYVTGFDATFIGATGTPQQLAEVRKAYGIVATRAPIAGSSTAYLIHHSNFIYLIDANGSLRAMSPYGRSVSDLVSDVKSLLKK